MSDRRRGVNLRGARAPAWAALAEQAPWPITPGQAEALETLAQTFCVKRGAIAMGVHPKTFEAHLSRARPKMGAVNSMHATLLWDRWRRPLQQRDFSFPPDHEALEHAAPAASPFPQLGRHVVPSAGVHAAAKG